MDEPEGHQGAEQTGLEDRRPDATVFEGKQVEGSEDGRLTGWRESEQRTRVGAAERDVGGHLVIFSDQVIDRGSNVRKRRPHHRDISFGCSDHERSGHEKLIQHGHVATYTNLIEVPTDQRLVRFLVYLVSHIALMGQEGTGPV